jgi:predicted dienelactone hydrolase
MLNSMLSIALATSFGLPGVSVAAENTSANAGDWGKFEVGSRVVHIDNDQKPTTPPIDVLLWYPADKQDYANGTPTVYASRLNGIPIVDPSDPDRWVPMSFIVAADRARDGVAIDQGGPSFPLIIFSHAAASDPQNVAFTLERLASHGFIIAAPWHNGDTQDDQRIDLINALAINPLGKRIFELCFDGKPTITSKPPIEPVPCIDGVNKAVQNRARDVAAILNTIPSLFPDRVDTNHVGLLGQSRGSLTAMAAAGGSKLLADSRIKAIMTLATAGANAMSLVNPGNIDDVPVLMVTSKADHNTDMSIAVDAFNKITSKEKALVVLERGEHAVYSINRCAQMQAAGAVFQNEPRAIGEKLTLDNILKVPLPGMPYSGTPIDYCLFDSFIQPVIILETVSDITGYSPDYIKDNVPKSLDAVTAMRLVLELANTFFDATLVKKAQPGAHFKQYLSPKFMLYKEGEALSYEQTESFQGRAVECDDRALASLDPSCAEE